MKVTIFEALHVAGGVLKYGIPEFRLPDMIIDAEIENLKKMGVEIRLDTIIGKLFTIPQLVGGDGLRRGLRRHRRGVAEIRRHSRRGVQRRLFGQRIPHARQPDARPPAAASTTRRSAWASAWRWWARAIRRWIRRASRMRMGAEQVTVVYRRSRRESPARAEELEHAIEEGIEFQWLTTPGGDPGQRGGLGHRHALPEDGTGRAGCLGPPPAGGGGGLGFPDSTWTR